MVLAPHSSTPQKACMESSTRMVMSRPPAAAHTPHRTPCAQGVTFHPQPKPNRPMWVYMNQHAEHHAFCSQTFLTGTPVCTPLFRLVPCYNPDPVPRLTYETHSEAIANHCQQPTGPHQPVCHIVAAVGTEQRHDCRNCGVPAGRRIQRRPSQCQHSSIKPKVHGWDDHPISSSISNTTICHSD